MDVYQLIFEKGTLGALKYANKIDSTNYVLASEIEDAVRELCTISSKINSGRIKLAQSLPSPEVQYYNPPSYNETQQTQAQPQGASGTETNVGREPTYQPIQSTEYTSIVKVAFNFLKLYFGWQKVTQSLYLTKSGKNLFNAAVLASGDASQIVPMLAGKVSPDDLGKIKGFLGNMLPKVQELLAAKEVVKSSPEATRAFNQLNDMYRLIGGTTEEIKNYKDIVRLFRSKFPTSPLLKTFEEETLKTAPKLLDEAGKAAIENAGKEVAEKAGKEVAEEAGKELAEKAGKGAVKKPLVEKLLGLIGKKVPQLANPLKIISTKLPFIGTIIEGLDASYNIYRDLENGELSNRTICLVLSTIASYFTTSSLVATIASGGTASPLLAAAIAIQTFVSLGCAFVTKGSDDRKEQKEQNYKNLNEANVNKYKTTIQTRDLNKEDLHLVDDIIRNSKTESELDNKIQSAISGKKFFDPAKALAMIQKQMDQKGLGKELKWSIFDYF